MRKSIDWLDAAGPLDAARLAGDPTIGLVVERILALLDGVAFAINSHVASAVLGETPGSPASSLEAARRTGLIRDRTARDLAPADGPPHVLLQLCLDSDPDEVAAIVATALAGYRDYVRQVTCWTAAAPGPG